MWRVAAAAAHLADADTLFSIWQRTAGSFGVGLIAAQTHRHGPVAALHLTAIMLTLFASVPLPRPGTRPPATDPSPPKTRRPDSTPPRAVPSEATQPTTRRMESASVRPAAPHPRSRLGQVRSGVGSGIRRSPPRSVRASPLPGGAQERGACQADDAQWTVEGGLRCREFPVDGLGDRRVGRPVGQAAP